MIWNGAVELLLFICNRTFLDLAENDFFPLFHALAPGMSEGFSLATME